MRRQMVTTMYNNGKNQFRGSVYKQNLKTKAISKNIHFHIMEGILEVWISRPYGVFKFVRIHAA